MSKSKRQQRKKATAYSYVRFSSPQQAKGDSLRRQVERSKAYAAEHDLKLDGSLNLHDLGVSAYKGNNSTEGKLAAFLAAINSGKVQSGSVLLVESLDRLSRQQVRKALTQFLNIINAGVAIVTLADNMRFDEDVDTMELVYSIMVMGRAHEESAIKSDRVGKAWGNKRKRAIEGGHKLTGQCPAWLAVNEDRTGFVVDKIKAAVVKRIFTLTADGYGLMAITKIFNDEEVPTFGKSEGWQKSYIHKIRTNRSVLGEYQPHTKKNRKRQPIGDPIPDYYPRIIDDELWHRAHASKAKRRGRGGRTGKHVRNLFSHLLKVVQFNPDDALVSPGVIVTKHGDKSGLPKLVASAATRGVKGWDYIGFNYPWFEHAILRFCAELDIKSIFTTDESAEAREAIEVVDGQLDDVNGRITQIQEQMIEGDISVLMPVIRKLQDQRDELQNQRDALEQQVNEHPASTAAADLQQLIKRVQLSSDEEAFDIRTKMKNRIRQVIEDITVVLEADGKTRMCEASIKLVNGYQRQMTMIYRGDEFYFNTTDAIMIDREDGQRGVVDNAIELLSDRQQELYMRAKKSKASA